MSFDIDVNILLYASDATSPLHAKAVGFLGRCAVGREVFYLTWPTLMGYLRMATHPAVFDRPLSHADAVRNVEALPAAPSCRVITEGESFRDAYREVTKDVPTRGTLVPDAHLAALLSQHGVVTLYTHDRDFRKLSFLWTCAIPWLEDRSRRLAGGSGGCAAASAVGQEGAFGLVSNRSARLMMRRHAAAPDHHGSPARSAGIRVEGEPA